MTISSTTRKAGPFNGNDVTVNLPFTFKVFAITDVMVVSADAAGVEVVRILTTDYTVSLNADQNTNPGGSVTMVVAPATGTTTTLASQVPNLQPADLTNGGGFYPAVITAALDRGVIQAQQLAEKLGRSLSLGISTPSAVSTALPPPTALSFLGWNALGTALVNYAGLSSVAISTFMATVNASASALIARAALGAGAVGDALFTSASTATARTALEVSSTAEMNTAIAAATTPLGGFRNRVLNGDFAIDQEFAGAVVTVTAGAALKYVIDGWYAYCTGANVTFQTTTVAGRKRARFTGLAANTGVGFATRIEAANSADMASAFATLRMLLSSSSITTVNWGLYYANTKDTFGTVATPTRTTIQTGSFTINATEAAYSAITSAILASGATTGLELVITVGALLGTQTLTIGDIQIEKGSVATPVFEVVAYQQQFNRCERYLRIIEAASGTAASSAIVNLFIPHVGMFIVPSVAVTAALTCTQPGVAALVQSSGNITIGTNTPNGGEYSCGNFSGFTAFGATGLRAGSGLGKIILKALIP